MVKICQEIGQRFNGVKNIIYLIGHEYVEAETEGDDEKQEDEREFHECVEDVGEHDHINAEAWHLPDEQHQIDPGQENGHSAQLPLNALCIDKCIKIRNNTGEI